MECDFAYIQKNIPYVLCKKEAVPTGADRKELFHAVCIHQIHCPAQNCHKLTAEWPKCFKLREKAAQKPQEGVRAAFVPEGAVDTEAEKTTRKRARKPKTEE